LPGASDQPLGLGQNDGTLFRLRSRGVDSFITALSVVSGPWSVVCVPPWWLVLVAGDCRGLPINHLASDKTTARFSGFNLEV
jgi:hypothetical protein